MPEIFYHDFIQDPTKNGESRKQATHCTNMYSLSKTLTGCYTDVSYSVWVYTAVYTGIKQLFLLNEGGYRDGKL